MTCLRPGTYTGVRYRGRYALPDVQARALPPRHTRSCRAVTGRHRDRVLPSASACSPWCTRAAVAASPPLVKVPRAHRLWVFINRRSRSRITTGFTYDKRSAYLLGVTVWRVDNYRSFLYAQGPDRNLPGEGPVMRTGRQHDPQHFSQHTQDLRRFAQVIHMAVHSKPA